MQLDKLQEPERAPVTDEAGGHADKQPNTSHTCAPGACTCDDV
jgi:hypothetical protein